MLLFRRRGGAANGRGVDACRRSGRIRSVVLVAAIGQVVRRVGQVVRHATMIIRQRRRSEGFHIFHATGRRQ